jgi:hypothetical protein
VPISSDTLHTIVQGFFSVGIILFKYFWWLLLLIMLIRGAESLLRLFGFGGKKKANARALSSRGKR